MRGFGLAVALLLAPLSASAAFHLWQITEVYSNPSGTVQYVELFTTFTFPSKLPSDFTANHHMLIATPGFASLPGAVTPDYTFAAADFLDVVADTLNFASGFDTISWTSGQLPTNETDSLHEDFGGGNRRTAANTPTNFAGQVGNLPEPGSEIAQLAGAALLAGLAKRRHARARLGV